MPLESIRITTQDSEEASKERAIPDRRASRPLGESAHQPDEQLCLLPDETQRSHLPPDRGLTGPTPVPTQENKDSPLQ